MSVSAFSYNEIHSYRHLARKNVWNNAVSKYTLWEGKVASGLGNIFTFFHSTSSCAIITKWRYLQMNPIDNDFVVQHWLLLHFLCLKAETKKGSKNGRVVYVFKIYFCHFPCIIVLTLFCSRKKKHFLSSYIKQSIIILGLAFKIPLKKKKI